MEVLTRIYADGPEVGISFAVSADRVGAVPGDWGAVTTQKWLFRAARRLRLLDGGPGAQGRAAGDPGRAVMAQSGLQIQVGQPTPSLADAVAAVAARYAGAVRCAAPIGVLPRARLARLARGRERSVSRAMADPLRHPRLGPGRRRARAVRGRARARRRARAQRQEHGAADDRGVAAGRWRRGRAHRRHRRTALPVARAATTLDRFASAGGEATAMFAQLRTLTGPVVVFIDDAEDVRRRRQRDRRPAVEGRSRPSRHRRRRARTPCARSTATGRRPSRARRPAAAAARHQLRRRPAGRGAAAALVGADGRRARLRGAERASGHRAGGDARQATKNLVRHSVAAGGEFAQSVPTCGEPGRSAQHLFQRGHGTRRRLGTGHGATVRRGVGFDVEGACHA